MDEQVKVFIAELDAEWSSQKKKFDAGGLLTIENVWETFRLKTSEYTRWRKSVEKYVKEKYPLEDIEELIKLLKINSADETVLTCVRGNLQYLLKLQIDDKALATISEGKKKDLRKTNKIFIVHGHDEEMKQSVARVISKLGLEPIILHEQTNMGDTIIEKLERCSKEVGYAIILLSADDEGRSKKEKEYKGRARQNVILEMGYFLGAIGRERIFILKKNEVEDTSDMNGVVYHTFNSGSWQYELCKELKESGYEVDANNLL